MVAVELVEVELVGVVDTDNLLPVAEDAVLALQQFAAVIVTVEDAIVATAG